MRCNQKHRRIARQQLALGRHLHRFKELSHGGPCPQLNKRQERRLDLGETNLVANLIQHTVAVIANTERNLNALS